MLSFQPPFPPKLRLVFGLFLVLVILLTTIPGARYATDGPHLQSWIPTKIE